MSLVGMIMAWIYDFFKVVLIGRSNFFLNLFFQIVFGLFTSKFPDFFICFVTFTYQFLNGRIYPREFVLVILEGMHSSIPFEISVLNAVQISFTPLLLSLIILSEKVFILFLYFVISAFF